MAKLKKTLAILLSFVMIITLCGSTVSACTTEDEADPLAHTVELSDDSNKYPFIFVHGMGGWGSADPFYAQSAYWGGGLALGTGIDLIQILNENGVEAYAPSVGPLSSAWDRACELYAQLAGTVVDYGEAHSKVHNHDRYGKDFTGKAIMGEPWNFEDKINLVGHSFGGETVRLFASLMAYGDADEVAASGSNTSELFKGGHSGVHSCITLSSPHNGSQIANILVDTQAPIFLMSFASNIMGTLGLDDVMPFVLNLGHFGLTPKEGEDTAEFDLKKVWDFFKANDNCGYDMTLAGAAELNSKIKLDPNAYYYSYSTCATKEGLFGRQWIIDTVTPIFAISSVLMALTQGMTIDGIKIEGDWAKNDGIVPLASSLYPLSDAETALDYEDSLASGAEIETGRWYYMDTMVGTDHFDFCGTRDYPTTFLDFYYGMINMANGR